MLCLPAVLTCPLRIIFIASWSNDIKDPVCETPALSSKSCKARNTCLRMRHFCQLNTYDKDPETLVFVEKSACVVITHEFVGFEQIGWSCRFSTSNFCFMDDLSNIGSHSRKTTSIKLKNYSLGGYHSDMLVR